MARGPPGPGGLRARIIVAGRADIPELLGLWEEYMTEMSKVVRIWSPPTRQQKAAERRRMARHFEGGGKVLALRSGRSGELVGMLWASVDDAPPSARVRRLGYISKVYLQPEFRGRGFTKRMLGTAYAWFRRKGVKWSSLYVMSDNRKATRAWERLGYEFVAHYMGKRI